MPSIEQKNINGKLFFYLTEQVRIKDGYKKLQVYLGKYIPKNLGHHYDILMNKEIGLIDKYLGVFFAKEKLELSELRKIEELRVRWKYFELGMSKLQRERFWRKFAIEFIFESNAIEGSRLSEKEVLSIVTRRNIKKSLGRREVKEVVNSLKAFDYLKSGDFTLNQRTIIDFHSLLVKGLGINVGYKKTEIIVNNKNTTAPGKVRGDMADLISWFNEVNRGKRHPLLIFADFHQRFERIHPFEDGNGRTGRLLFNWMLIKADYPPILFRKKNRDAYFNALNQADEGRKLKWHRYVIEVYKRTVRDFLAIVPKL